MCVCDWAKLTDRPLAFDVSFVHYTIKSRIELFEKRKGVRLKILRFFRQLVIFFLKMSSKPLLITTNTNVRFLVLCV